MFLYGNKTNSILFSLLEVKKRFSEALNENYSTREIDLFFQMICEDVFHFSKIDLMIGNASFSEEQVSEVHKILERILQNEPIQYIIGKAHFYGSAFKVTPNTLIPRPETEELVNWILEDKSNLKGLDIGTGTGCIPISLNLQGVAMQGVDISDQALMIAKENNKALDADVLFTKIDVLTEPLSFKEAFDFVVSNPPYVLDSDKKEMSSHVLDFEPHLALFVSDDDPLIFYRVIAEKSLGVLKKGGKLYFEIHESKGEDVISLCEVVGYVNVELKNDLQGKPRMVKAVHNG